VSATDEPLQWSEDEVRVGDAELVVLKAGTGKPLVVLHEELGHPGELRWQREIGASRTLLVPLHPGFGKTPRCEWITNARDLAAFYAAFLRGQKLAPADVIGISFGGWIAAEMIATDPALVRRAVLVAPPGIRPNQGEIFDLFRVTAKKYVQATVLEPGATAEFSALFGGQQTPEQFEAWEDARAEIARLAWAPYLFDPSLPQRLALVPCPPTLVLWGKQDAIVPAEVGELYAKSLPGTKLVVFDGCGHRPEIEKRQEFVKEVQSFLG
jgi:pimeloyl-ACP methyl ester carboxylesterase